MKEIILIGPIAVGKTTTAKLLSKKLNKPIICMDDIHRNIYKEIGYNNDHMEELLEKVGIMAAFQYAKIFDTYSIEKTLAKHQNCIFDFGAGNAVSGCDFDFDRIKQALNPYENVVLLIPSADKKESLDFIYKRRDVKPSHRELIEYLVFNHSNSEVAKHTVYVKDKTPEEVCNEVLFLTNNLQQND